MSTAEYDSTLDLEVERLVELKLDNLGKVKLVGAIVSYDGGEEKLSLFKEFGNGRIDPKIGRIPVKIARTFFTNLVNKLNGP